MQEITKTVFKDLPDTSTPLTAEFLNEFQDKIIENFNNVLFFTTDDDENVSTQSLEENN